MEESPAVECRQCGRCIPGSNALLHSVHCVQAQVTSGRKRPRSPAVVDLTSPSPERPRSQDLEDCQTERCAVMNDSGTGSALRLEKYQQTQWRPYYTLALPALPKACNENALSLSDIICGDIKQVLLMNYMIDFDWIAYACPILKDTNIPVCFLHGQKNGAQRAKTRYIVENELFNWTCSAVDLGAERFGTHHSKAAIIFYPNGVRFALMTANFIEIDFLGKTQGVFVQDFPLKDRQDSPQSSFEKDLILYLSEVRVASIDTATAFQSIVAKLRNYDFSSAEVVLVAGVPGRHRACDAKWGHLKLAKAVLDDKAQSSSAAHNRPDAVGAPSLLMQFSSIGSMGSQGKYLSELTKSLNGGPCSRVQLVWPTVKCVANSLQGYPAGSSLPCSAAVMYDRSRLKEGFAGNLHRWEGEPVARHAATPHMKCYFKYRPNGTTNILEWFLLTSMNLSQAAWGVLQNNNSKLYIKSYELGVLFLPNRVKQRRRVFSCTPTHVILGEDLPNSELPEAISGNFLGTSIPIDIPFMVPPPIYTSDDVPWTWDTTHLLPDRFFNTWFPGCIG